MGHHHMLLSCACVLIVVQVADAALLLPEARRLPTDQELAQLEAAIGYNFTNPWLLRQALLHPSYGEFNNARMSWLGDAVMGAIVSDLLVQTRPFASTEELHEARKHLVRRETCAEFGARLRLDKLLVIGRGYEAQEPTEHMIAEGFEALWGAVHIDSGYRMDKVKEVYAASFPVK